MIGVAIDLTFNGVNDDELETVDLPKAYLRFLANITPDLIYWLDATYNPTEPTSEQLSLIEDGIGIVTGAANA